MRTLIQGSENAPSERPPAQRITDPWLGRVIDGRYRVESVLGQGAMGVVYRVTHIALDKPLALKVLCAPQGDREEFVGRFHAEARSASAIGHPNITDVNDFGTLPDGSLYYVMEFLNGIELEALIEWREDLPLKRILDITIQICEALHAAHQHGIVHRDLKPENVYLVTTPEKDDFVKIIDFGIAKVANAPRLTAAGSVFGTPYYMSPEQCEGEPIDHRSDIYALGIMLYEMITGHVPFDADNVMAIMAKHAREEPLAPSRFAPDLPEEFEKIILRCMSKAPDERFDSMLDLATALKNIDLSKPAPSVPPPRRTSFRPPTPRESRVVLLGAAAAVLGLLTTYGVNAWTSQSGEEASTRLRTLIGADSVVALDQTREEDKATSEKPQLVEILSKPEGATVALDDQVLGETPLSIERPTKDAILELTLKKARYQDKTLTIDASSTLKPVMLTPAQKKSTQRNSKRKEHSILLDPFAEQP